MSVAEELAANVMQEAGIEEYEIIGTCQGQRAGVYGVCRIRSWTASPCLILGDHVTLDSGTGCVHTAPGHGMEDFDGRAQHYPEIPITVPVDSEGRLTEEAGFSLPA